MTLISFRPTDLDDLALRLVDLAAEARRMALRSREHDVEAVPLHGNKVQDWLARLESWSRDAAARTDAEVNQQLGAKRARELLKATRRRKPRKSK